MCYHKASPQKADLQAYLEAQKIEAEIADYDVWFHANGFNHPQMPVLTIKEPHKVQTFMWGMVPVYAKDRKEAQDWAGRMLNATCEKADSTYKYYFKSQRCLVFVNGFYEWQWKDSKGKDKQPFFIYRAGGGPFTMGGIYNEWADRETGELFSTYAVVTTPANELMSEIHNNKKRMPLVLQEQHWSQWLDPQAKVQDLLRPCEDGFLKAHEITKEITRKGYDTNVPEIQQPVTTVAPGSLF